MSKTFTFDSTRTAICCRSESRVTPLAIGQSVGELAERLKAQQHGVVALTSRCEVMGLVERRRSAEDRRWIEIHLLKNGEQLFASPAHLHRAALLSLRSRFVVLDAGF